MFIGWVKLEASIRGILIVRDTDNVPTDADELPTFRVHGPDGFVEDSSVEFLNSGLITGATNATPVVITSSDHKLTTGVVITVENVGGNTTANGKYRVTRLTANTFSLDDSGGGGDYTSGGTWHMVGVYSYQITAAAANGYDIATKFDVLFAYQVSSDNRAQVDSFLVV